MLLGEKEKQLVKMASAKWQNKHIHGPDGNFFVSIVYYRGEGWLEALVFPEDGGMPRNIRMSELKQNFTILA